MTVPVRLLTTGIEVSGNKTFEILTMRGGSWSIEATTTSLESAKAEAAKMLNRPNTQGVRVIQESRKSIAQLGPEDILFEKLRIKNEDKIFVQHILDAPMCSSTADLFERPARMTINQLFRAYLDKNNITAGELMHSAKEIKRLLDEGTLISSATGKVATIQAKKQEGATTNQRRDMLFEYVNEINAKARTAADQKLPRIRDAGFNDVLERITGSAAAGDADYLMRVAISTELLDTRSYFGKLVQLLEWSSAVDSDQAFVLLDFFISDVLWNADVIRDLLGDQRDLGSALVTMICFANGEPLTEELPEGLSPEHPKFVGMQLNQLIAEGRLPDTQTVLFDRIKRQLEGLNPLSRGDREEEREVFFGLLNKLIPDIEMIGGAAMAEAVTARQSTLINKGGNKGMKEAAASMLPSLNDPGRKTGYLLALLECEIGQEVLRADIDDHLDAILVKPPSVNHLVRDKLPPNKKMQKLTSIYYRVEKSRLPDDRKERLTKHLDDLLASYIVDGKILDKVNNPERPLHIRANMLLSMVQPDMLPSGRASALARDIIVKHLKRPNFEAEFVSQIPDAEQKARSLRQFHEQLRRCGFFG